MHVCVVGATGLVGGVMIKVLEETRFPVSHFTPVASEKSLGKKVLFNNKEYDILSVKDAVLLKPDVAIFSAGGKTSLEWAGKFAEAGTFVIDNSSAWRMDNTKKLIVPEINAHLLNTNDKIISNPNCSTIQLVAALADIHKKYGIKRLVVSTYQSVTGTGVQGVKQLEGERKGEKPEKAYPYQIDLNVIPHGGSFEENGYTTEETKLVNETRKILGDESIMITATVVRVPVYGGHSIAVNVELSQEFELEELSDVIRNTNGVIMMDEPEKNIYPMPLYSEGKDEVFVGRLRRDFSKEACFNLWIVADNLRKGAATNAVQIASYLLSRKFIG